MQVNDFVKTIDLTAIDPINASDINTLVDTLSPESDKGIILWTADTALNVPVVPNAAEAGYERWKRCIWLRIPDSSAVSLTPIAYGWNDDVASDATLLKWVALAEDLTLFLAQLNNATNTANQALVTAGQAKSTADQANANSSGLTASITTAQNTANDAKTKAESSLAKIGAEPGIYDDIHAHFVSIEGQLGTLNTAGPKSPANALTKGAGGQQIRTSTDASTVEWFSPKDCHVRATETGLAGSPAGTAVKGRNQRNLGSLDDPGDIASLADGKVKLKAGVYRVFAQAAGRQTDHVAAIEVGGATTLVGTVCEFNNAGGYGNITTYSTVVGLITAEADDTEVALVTYALNGANKLGLAPNSNISSPGGHCYAFVELYKIQ